jgi:hypothetical protein
MREPVSGALAPAPRKRRLGRLLNLTSKWGNSLLDALERSGANSYADPEVDLWLLLLSSNDGGGAWSVWPPDERRPLNDDNAIENLWRD